MPTYKERRDKRFHEHTKTALKDIEERGPLPLAQGYAAAYGILRYYVEFGILANFAEAFSEEQLGEIRIVLDQLAKLTGENYSMDDATKAKLDQLAQTLRESE